MSKDDVKKLKVGDRVFWSGEGESGGKVVEVDDDGMTIDWDDESVSCVGFDFEGEWLKHLHPWEEEK